MTLFRTCTANCPNCNYYTLRCGNCQHYIEYNELTRYDWDDIRRHGMFGSCSLGHRHYPTQTIIDCLRLICKGKDFIPWNQTLLTQPIWITTGE